MLDLPVERRLTLVTDPRRREGVEIFVAQSAVTGVLDVAAYERFMDVAGQPGQDIGVVLTNRKNGDPLGGIATTSTNSSDA